MPWVREHLTCLRSRCQIVIDQWQLRLFKPKPAPATRKRVGILRLDGLGDLVLFLDALKGFRQFFAPDAYEISIIVEDWLAGLLKNCSDVDHIMVVSKNRFRKNQT